MLLARMDGCAVAAPGTPDAEEHPVLGTCRLHSELRHNSLYLMVTPAGDVTADPVPLSLAGIRPESRSRLRTLLRGDAVPADILSEIVALAPSFVGRALDANGSDAEGAGKPPS